jgi:hypothetical protein
VASTCATLVGVSIAALAVDGAIGWMLPPVVLGTLMVTIALFVVHARDRQAAVVADSFVDRSTPGDLIDIARVRVAGLGGVGLMFMAMLAALQFQLTTLALLTGLVGGTLGAAAVILHRRHSVR